LSTVAGRRSAPIIAKPLDDEPRGLHQDLRQNQPDFVLLRCAQSRQPLCGLVDARVIDQDGLYNPSRPNDRLLLGMKGSISEFELGVLRARMLDAARSKARRGELRLPVPF
jgi:hypothetical protein